MKSLRRGWKRLIGTIASARHEPDLSDEIETHLQMMSEDNLRTGMSPQEARRAAVLKFGGVDSTKEFCRDQLGFPLIRSLWQDVRFAFRMLHRTPSISVPAVLALALGIGTATALYAIVYAMWLRPLPYPGADRLVSVTTYFAGYKLDVLASPDYGTWQGTRSLGALAAYSVSNAAMIAPGETVEVGRASVSGNLLDVLRIHAAVGRGIQPADDGPEAPRVVMLSEGLWRVQFGADANVIGRSTRMDGEAYTIIGVLPRSFRMPDERRVDLLTPLSLGEGWLRHGSGGAMKILYGVARLQPGVTLAKARAELSARLSDSRAQDPQIYREDVSLRVIPLQEYAVRDVRTVAIVLIGAMASILLIASANVASLLVARAIGRGRDGRASGVGSQCVTNRQTTAGGGTGFRHDRCGQRPRCRARACRDGAAATSCAVGPRRRSEYRRRRAPRWHSGPGCFARWRLVLPRAAAAATTAAACTYRRRIGVIADARYSGKLAAGESRQAQLGCARFPHGATSHGINQSEGHAICRNSRRIATETS